MANRKNKAIEPHCDFCKKAKSEVGGQLVAGPGSLANGRKSGEDNVWICPECVGTIAVMFHNEGVEVVTKPAPEKQAPLPALVVPDPRVIKQYLDQHVIGQDHAKKVLSVAVANHYKRLGSQGDFMKEVQIDKSNVLLIGPTGSGKTLLASKLARILQVPFAVGDATTITEAGYVGEDVENLLLRLLQNADMNIEAAQRGIIYLDEVDKIGRSNQNTSLTRDVSGEGVQQSLLKMLEGTIAQVPPQGGRKHPDGKYIPFDTTNVLFICGGTFVGLTDIIKRRIGGSSMGFHAVSKEEVGDDELLRRVSTDDLVEFGMIPEFIGRIPVKTGLNKMTEDGLVRVLTEPQNALVKQYQKLMHDSNVDLKFDDEACREIAKKALKMEVGARALRSVVEEVMLDIMYDVSDHKGQEIVITGERIRRLEAA
jgi:ATP-dependent Clp protease ATP-binding subunit ClpX